MSDEAYAGLKQLAQQFGASHGDDPSVSGVIELIGLNMLKVTDQDQESLISRDQALKGD